MLHLGLSPTDRNRFQTAADFVLERLVVCRGTDHGGGQIRFP